MNIDFLFRSSDVLPLGSDRQPAPRSVASIRECELAGQARSIGATMQWQAS